MPSLRQIKRRRGTHIRDDARCSTPCVRPDISMRTLGRSVFGSATAFERWLALPLPALHGRRPRELLLESTGAREIREMLMRIYYGVY